MFDNHIIKKYKMVTDQINIPAIHKYENVSSEKSESKRIAFKFAVSFALVAVILGTSVFSGRIPLLPRTNQNSQVHDNAFTLVAYAEDALNSKITLEQNKMVTLSSGFDNQNSGVKILSSVTTRTNNDDASETMTFTTNFGFKCIGENIDKVTFKTEKGEFCIKKFLTKDEIAQLKNSEYIANTTDFFQFIPSGTEQTIDYSKDANLQNLIYWQYSDTFIGRQSINRTDDMISHIGATTITVTVLFKDGQTVTKTMKLNFSKANSITATVK